MHRSEISSNSPCALSTVVPFLKCSFCLKSMKHFSCFPILYWKLILFEIPVDPSCPYFLFPTFDYKVFNSTSLVIFYRENIIRLILISFSFWFLCYFISFDDTSVIAFFPTVEKVVILVMRESPEKELTHIVNFQIFFLLTACFLDHQKAFHIHTFFKHISGTYQECFLLLNTMSPCTEN